MSHRSQSMFGGGSLSAPAFDDNNTSSSKNDQFFFGHDFNLAMALGSMALGSSSNTDLSLSSTMVAPANTNSSSSGGDGGVGSSYSAAMPELFSPPPSSLTLQSPSLVPNSLYSLSELRSPSGPFSSSSFSMPPLSAPHLPRAAANNECIGGFDHRSPAGGPFSSSNFSVPPLSAPPLPRFATNNNECIDGFDRSKQQARKAQPTYFSLKVFLGGIPAGMTANVLQMNFANFGKNTIDWPKKLSHQERPPNGYAFVVFEQEESIIRMLRLCYMSNNRLFFTISMVGPSQIQHPVEIKVWEMKDTTYVGMPGWRQFRRYSVFVGGIPRTCTAAMLASSIQEVIGPVAYVTIELDRQHFYPKGAACVVFTGSEPYIKAIAVHEVMLSFGTFERKVEFKPFLASNMPCEKCACTNGTRFCAEMICLAYFCSNCWKRVHSQRASLGGHTPSRRFVGNGGGGFGGGGHGRRLMSGGIAGAGGK